MTIPATSFTQENARWKSYFVHSVNRHLDRAINLVIENKKRPQRLVQHFESMVAVFEQGIIHSNADTQQKLMQFVRAFHPLPVWWGKWIEWMQVLDKAIRLVKSTNEEEHLIWLYLTKAEMLLSTGNATKALELSTEALLLADKYQPELHFRAELVRFEANKFLGNITDRIAAIEALENSLGEKTRLLPEQATRRLEAELLLKKADVLRRQGYLDGALELNNKALDLANKYARRDKLFMAEVYSQHSHIYWAREELDKAIKGLKLVNEIYEELGNQTAQIDCLGDLGLTYWSALRYDEAEQTLQTSIHMAEEEKALWWQAVQTGDLGLVNFTRGRLPQALALMQQHYALSELTDNKPETERANGNIGYVQIFMGNFQEAHDRLRRDLEFIDETKLYVTRGTVCANLAWALEGLGRFEEALEYAKESLSISEQMNSPQLRIVALRSLSELQKDPGEKARYAEEALTLAKERSRRLNEAGALLTLSTCFEDDRYRQEAVTILEELGSQDWLKMPLAFKTLRLPLLLWG